MTPAIMMMNRELRRVPLDFDWPIDKVWKGYVNPHDCPDCPDPNCAFGYTRSGYWLKNMIWMHFLHAVDDMHHGKIHPWRVERCVYNDVYPTGGIEPFLERLSAGDGTPVQNAANTIIDLAGLDRTWGTVDGEPTSARKVLEDFLDTLLSRGTRWHEPILPSGDIVELCTKLVGNGSSPFGYSDLDAHRLIDKLSKKLGFKEKWRTCKTCKGKASIPSKEYKKWKPFEPPKGKGYQLWETISEGSPITPVFSTKEALLDYLVGHGKKFVGRQLSRGEWQKVLGSDCPAVGVETGEIRA